MAGRVCPIIIFISWKVFFKLLLLVYGGANDIKLSVG
jgi:hypothetical protein